MYNGSSSCLLHFKILHAVQARSVYAKSSPRQSRRLHSTRLQWKPLRRISDGSLEIFRSEAFIQALPALLPQGHFNQIPALRTWFLQPENPSSSPRLNIDHFTSFKDAIVPLEVTHSGSDTDANSVQHLFQRAEGPLSLFLSWATTANSETQERIYLAQASIHTLPQPLIDDLTTPELVLEAGKGDIYDTSIWLGVPPTYTPLHKDPNPNLFVQLAGRKVVRLLPPDAGREVFANVQAALGKGASASLRGEEMMEGEEKRLLEAAVWGTPMYSDDDAFAGQEAYLDSGDGLFIPKGWWHSIKGIGTGISGSVSWHFLSFIRSSIAYI